MAAAGTSRRTRNRARRHVKFAVQMPSGPHKVPMLEKQMVASFGHIVYHPWQVRLLISSSCSFLVGSLVNLAVGQVWLAILLLFVGCVSINYWRSPGASWRRTADMLCSILGIAFTTVAGFYLEGNVLNSVGWLLGIAGARAYRLVASPPLRRHHCNNSCRHAHQSFAGG